LKKTYGWLFSPHRMQTCLVCLSQRRGRSLIQWKQHTNFTLIMQKWLDSVWEPWGLVNRLNTGFATGRVL
jgi:hypothetical protein